MNILQVYRPAHARYFFNNYSKYSPVHGFNLDEHQESTLLDCFKEYDWVHFWSQGSLETMSKMFDEKDRPIITFLNPFGQPMFPHNEKPFDIQFHNSKHSLAKYFRLDKEGWLCENIVSYLPVDTEVFAPKDRERGKDFIVARTGRPDVWKWDLFTLKVVEGLVRKGLTNNVKLLIIGGMPKFAKDYALKHDIPIAASIQYRKRDEDTDKEIAHLLWPADIYIHSSFIGESCGVSILEAMSLGLPVVAKNTPYADNAPAEYIKNHVNGILVKDAKEGTEEAWKIAKDPELGKQLGREARKTIEQTFDTRKVIKRMEDAVSMVRASEQVRVDKSKFGARLRFLIGVQERRRGLIK